LVDDYVTKTGIDVPKENQPVEGVAEPNEISNPILELDLRTARITSIVWATGFRNDFGWVKLPIFNDTGAHSPAWRHEFSRNLFPWIEMAL
jgi:putative flavoprotein involved in K+ transport